MYLLYHTLIMATVVCVLVIFVTAVMSFNFGWE